MLTDNEKAGAKGDRRSVLMLEGHQAAMSLVSALSVPKIDSDPPIGRRVDNEWTMSGSIVRAEAISSEVQREMQEWDV